MFVEPMRALVQSPYVKSNAIGALLAREFHDAIIDSSVRPFATQGFVCAEVIDAEGQDVSKDVVVKMLLEHAEGIPKDLSRRRVFLYGNE